MFRNHDQGDQTALRIFFFSGDVFTISCSSFGYNHASSSIVLSFANGDRWTFDGIKRYQVVSDASSGLAPAVIDGHREKVASGYETDGSQLDKPAAKKVKYDSDPVAPAAPASFESPKSEADYSIFTCRCDTPCKLEATKKAGPNQGRHFFSCGKGVKAPDNCKFFCWFDLRESEFASKKKNSPNTTNTAK